MYTSGSNRYNQGPSNILYNTASGQIHRNFNYAETPAARTIATRPDYVIINPDAAGATYIFGYASNGTNCTASIGGFDSECSGSAITGSVVSDDGSPIKLEINPIWWDTGNDEAAGTTGEVTFVYSKQDK